MYNMWHTILLFCCKPGGGGGGLLQYRCGITTRANFSGLDYFQSFQNKFWRERAHTHTQTRGDSGGGGGKFEGRWDKEVVAYNLHMRNTRLGPGASCAVF